MTVLADAAPTGAGLAIVAIVLLAFAAVVVGVIALVIWLIVRSRRRPPLVPPGPVETDGFPAPPPVEGPTP